MTEKKQKGWLFARNLFIYTAIFAGCYYLYNYRNTSAKNKPHTDFSFVYAQF